MILSLITIPTSVNFTLSTIIMLRSSIISSKMTVKVKHHVPSLLQRMTYQLANASSHRMPQTTTST